MEFDNSFEVPLPPDAAWAVLTDIQRIAPCMPGAELTDVVDDRTYKGKIAVRLGPVALAFAGTVMFEEMDAATRSARVKAQGADAKGRGGANAAASFRLEPVAAGGGTKVLVHTDLTLSGSVAQYGRGVGMIQATAAQIMSQFAANLKAQLARTEAAPVPSTATPAPRTAAPAEALPPVPEPIIPPTPSRMAAPVAQPVAPVTAPTPPLAVPDPAQGTPLGTAPYRHVPPAAKPISGFTLMAKVVWNSILRRFTGRPPGA